MSKRATLQRATRPLLIPLLVLVGHPGCGMLTMSCTEAGCEDGVSLSVHTSDGVWPAGRYTVELTADNDPPIVCNGMLPQAEVRMTGQLIELDCTQLPFSRGAFFEPASVCSEQRTQDAVTQSCMPVPGQLELKLGIGKAPRSLRLQVERDGTALLDQLITPEYERLAPNGEECGPICRVAQAKLTVP